MKGLLKNLTIGKIIGCIAFIITEIIVFLLFAHLETKDLIAIGYIQLSVFGVVWGAVGVKRFIENKGVNKNV